MRKGKKLNQFGNWILQQSKSNSEESGARGKEGEVREGGRESRGSQGNVELSKINNIYQKQIKFPLCD